MNNDMLPVGTTLHINPEDIKWEWNDGDLISRSALLKELDECNELVFTCQAVKDIINNVATVTPDVEFAKWVTKMIFDNNTIKDFDFELFSELACRKLEKLGLVEKTDSEWIMKGGAV